MTHEESRRAGPPSLRRPAANLPQDRGVGGCAAAGSCAHHRQDPARVHLRVARRRGVGSTTLREVTKYLGPVGRALGREFNPAVFPPREFRKKVAEEDHFIREVLEGAKIWLIGNDRELAGLVA